MRKITIFFFIGVFSTNIIAQTLLSGKVMDAVTGEPLIGATIIFGKGQGTATDFDGKYSLLLQPGARNIKVSYVGYQEISNIIQVGKESQQVDFKLKLGRLLERLSELTSSMILKR